MGGFNPQIVSHMDYLGRDSARGEVAQLLLNQRKLDPLSYRPYIGTDGRAYISAYIGGPKEKLSSYAKVPLQANAAVTLRQEEWQQLDRAVLQVARERLGGFDDVLAAGLTYNLGNAMGTMVLRYDDISDGMAAVMSMDGVTRHEGDRPVYESNYLPIPIIHADFEINERELAASRNLGNPLDTTMVEQATRRILEQREDLLFTDTSYTYGNGTIYSYLNHPKRATKTDTEVWDDSASATDIVTDVREMKQLMINRRHYGPYQLYIPTEYETRMDDDYVTTNANTKTIRQRIMEVDGIKGIKVIDRLTGGNVLMVQMVSSTVRIVNGLGLTVIQWKADGGFVTKFKVFLIQVPQVRADQKGQSGLVHMSLT